MPDQSERQLRRVKRICITMPECEEGRSHLTLQGQPAFLVRAEVNHATRDYREGDALSVGVASEVDAYLYVFYQQADGKGTYCVG